ncbi:MAG TPA: hypothetical protein VFB04_18380 [Terriglobales bacterium]|nr:hypothetical protein [Terriglobales bacterium]
MFHRKLGIALGSTVVLMLSVGVSARGQVILYNNGPDGNDGYYQTSFGAVVTNSFNLSADAILSGGTLTLYAVDDRNTPLRVKWTITTQPFGGAVMGEGFVNLESLGNPYPTRFHFFAWRVGFPIPHISLPAGTYYLQIQDVITRWDTYIFWAQSSGGSAQGYYNPAPPNGAGGISVVPSESFAILGERSSGKSAISISPMKSSVSSGRN